MWQGHGDSPLSDKGRTQANALGELLAQDEFDLVLSSDLSRAADTGRAVRPDLELDPAWRDDPYPSMKALRESDPVNYVPGADLWRLAKLPSRCYPFS